MTFGMPFGMSLIEGTFYYLITVLNWLKYLVMF